eukprot:2466421-Lingulodinium_polyedra.AAC.1
MDVGSSTGPCSAMPSSLAPPACADEALALEGSSPVTVGIASSGESILPSKNFKNPGVRNADWNFSGASARICFSCGSR